jgi:hypothetical protein
VERRPPARHLRTTSQNTNISNSNYFCSYAADMNKPTFILPFLPATQPPSLNR